MKHVIDRNLPIEGEKFSFLPHSTRLKGRLVLVSKVEKALSQDTELLHRAGQKSLKLSPGALRAQWVCAARMEAHVHNRKNVNTSHVFFTNLQM